MLALLIVGVILLCVAYTVPGLPAPLGVLMRVLGIICVAVALIIIVLGLLGVAGAHPLLGWRC
jgi:hypothetical protein